MKLTNTLPPGDIYERLTQSLESLDANYCLFPGALSEIVVTGGSGYRAELLSLCWCRWGEEKEVNYCRDFLSLSKSAIQKLIGYYGSLVRLHTRRRASVIQINSLQERDFLRDFDELKQLQQLLNCDEVPLGQIFTVADLASGEGLRPILTRLQAKWDEVSDEEVSPIAQMIERLVEIISQQWTQPTSVQTGMNFSGKKEKVRDFIRAYYLKHRCLPEGDLAVPEVGVVGFSAPPS